MTFIRPVIWADVGTHAIQGFMPHARRTLRLAPGYTIKSRVVWEGTQLGTSLVRDSGTCDGYPTFLANLKKVGT